MARVLCSLSGVEFQVEHFPIYLTSREHYHPIFSVSQKKLLSYESKWESGGLTPIDSYLLYLALLNSTECIQFRSPAQRTTVTDSVVAHTLPDLFQVVSAIGTIKSPHFAVPQFVITPDTKTLDTAKYWIQAWEQCLEEFRDGYTTFTHRRKQEDKERYLEKLIKSGEKETVSYASSLADWAELAAGFPTGTIPTCFGQISLSEYWKRIIRRCCTSDSIFSIPLVDIQELIEHCEDNLDAGSIYAYALFKLLRAGEYRHKNFLGLDVGYKILAEDDSVEDANKLLMIQTAPEFEPKLSEYPTRLAWLKAKTKYELAQAYKLEQEQKKKDSGDDPEVVPA